MHSDEYTVSHGSHVSPVRYASIHIIHVIPVIHVIHVSHVSHVSCFSQSCTVHPVSSAGSLHHYGWRRCLVTQAMAVRSPALTAAPALPGPFQGLNHSDAESREPPFILLFNVIGLLCAVLPKSGT